MEYKFSNRHLNDLYHSGKSRKYKPPPGAIKKFFMRIQQFEAANDIYDLWKTPSLKFEKLEGYENKYSVRVDDQWRLEFYIKWQNTEKTKGIINIAELSKHYGA